MEHKLPKHIRKNSILLYGDHLKLVKQLPESECGRLFVALLEFAETGKRQEVTFRSKLTDLVYTVLMEGLERDRIHYLEICEQNRLRAERRWAKERAREEGEREEGESGMMTQGAVILPNDA